MFRTCAQERERVVFQMGAADAGTALRAATVVAGDVAGIDVNMGCPKHFSTQGGMGAALLTNLPVATDIIKTLRRGLPAAVTVTCKVRILSDDARTIDLLRALEQAGAQAIAVHCRHVHERPADPAHWDRLTRQLAESVSVPLIANGDVFTYSDAERLRASSGFSSVMIARGAMWNPSIFRPAAAGGLVDGEVVVRQYVQKSECRGFARRRPRVARSRARPPARPAPHALLSGKAVALGMPYQNAKYVAMEMLNGCRQTKSAEYRALSASRSMRDIAGEF